MAEMIINGVKIAEPDNYSPSKNVILANQLVTGSGKRLADVIREVVQLQLKWDYIPTDILKELMTATSPVVYPSFPVTYYAADSQRTGVFRTESPVNGVKIDDINGGHWGNVTLTLGEI